MRRIGNSNILITIGIAIIVIPICCYLLVLFSNSGVLSKMSFNNFLSKTRIEIPSVNCYDNAQKWLTGQYDDDYGSVFLKKDSTFFATFKEDDNLRKGYKYELINLSEIGDKLDKAAGWMAGSDELIMYPLRTFVDKDMPMKDVLNVLYKIRPYRPKVAFVLRDRGTSDYIYCYYRIDDSSSTVEAYNSFPYYKRIQISKYRSNTFEVFEVDAGSLVENLENFFDTLFSYPNPNSYVVVVNIEGMTFEDYVSVVYEYIKIVHKHRNDYCLKTYGKPFGRLDHSHQKEVKELYPQNILIR